MDQNDNNLKTYEKANNKFFNSTFDLFDNKSQNLQFPMPEANDQINTAYSFQHNENRFNSKDAEEFGCNKCLNENEIKRNDAMPVITEDKCNINAETDKEKETIVKAIQDKESNSNVNQGFNVDELFKIIKSEEVFTKSEITGLLEDINHYPDFDDDNIKKSYSIIADDYLTIQDYNYDEVRLNEDFNIFLRDFDEKKDLYNLKKMIQKQKAIPDAGFNIGPVSTLDYLVEISFNSDSSKKKSMIENLLTLDDIVFRWRRAGGDGNCFYRSVIFAYFENIILENNITLLQYLILDINNKFKDKLLLIYLAKHGIKVDLVLKILVLMYLSLIYDWDNGIEKAYDLYLKCFNNCKHFDLGLIFYFRFKLYEFIKANQEKLYTKDFSVKIGNLLPAEYETEEGNFLYEKFYDDYLMKLYKDAEKIVIYLTPFVLKINLNVLVYDFGKNNLEKLKEFPCLLPNAPSKPTITLLYRKTHYDIIYDQKYFEKLTKYLSIYVNLSEDLKVVDGKLLEEVNKIKKTQQEKLKEIAGEEAKEKEGKFNLLDFDNIPCVNKNEVDHNHANSPNHATGNYTDINMDLLIPQHKDVEEKKNTNNLLDDFKLIKSVIPNFQNEVKENIENKQPINDIISAVNINFIQPTRKCSECKKDYIPYQLAVKLCNNCLFLEIKTNTLFKYFQFLSTSRKNFQDKRNPNEAPILFKVIFYDTVVKILDQSFTISEAFKLIDSDFNTFLINNVKNSVCVICESSMNPTASTLSYFVLPCNCVLCSESCLKNYFNLMFLTEAKKRRKDFICICSTNYNANDMKQLLLFCHSKNMKSNKDKILEVYKERVVNQCMLCLQERNKEGNFSCGYKSSRESKDEKGVVLCEMKDNEMEKLLKIKEFNHLICFTCFQEHFATDTEYNSKKSIYELNKPQYCMICNSIHYVEFCKLLKPRSALTCSNDCKIQ